MNILFLLEAVSLNERLAEGTTALIAGMGTVFIILILISSIISLFKYIGKSDRPHNRSDIKLKAFIEAGRKVEPVHTQDDLELIAVITTVIASSLNITTDQLQVKSFRRIRSKN